MTYDIPTMVSEATGVLKSLIAIPSLSRDKEKAADYRQNYIELQGMVIGRKGNNVRYLSPMFDLNKPNESYSNEELFAEIQKTYLLRNQSAFFPFELFSRGRTTSDSVTRI